MTEMELRNRVVSAALLLLGKNEADGSHREIIDTYNKHLPRPRGHKLAYTEPWCAATVSAVHILCGTDDIAPVECSCNSMIQLYKAEGRWVEDDAYVPQPGDAIFYDWQDSGKGDNTGAADHVGIVVEVRGDDILVLEGNYEDKVQTRSMKVNGRYIRGYGCPDYAAKAAELSPAVWYEPARQWAIEAGITVSGDRPNDLCTRAEVWQMLYKMVKGGQVPL